jgi:hypothetical protein
MDENKATLLSTEWVRSEPHLSLRPREELDPELTFQGLDLLAEGGLSDPKALGGPAEVQLLGHRHEVAQVTEFHHRSLLPSRRSFDGSRRP